MLWWDPVQLCICWKSFSNSKLDIDLTVLGGRNGESDEDEDNVSPLDGMIVSLIFEINSLLALPPPWRMMMPLVGALILSLDRDPSRIMMMGRLIPHPSNFESLYLQSELLISKQLWVQQRNVCTISTIHTVINNNNFQLHNYINIT